MTTPVTTFACPGCGVPTAVGTPRCERCRIRLVGELAMQLWQLDQQLAFMRAHRDVLVARLRRDDGADVLPQVAVRGAPGSETRRALLVLGAVCLIAALTAGTALIWPALGVGGQTAVMLVVTAALLAGAVRLQDRLPATAEAVAAVAAAATAVDVVAGRRLVAPGLAGAAAHSYWMAASLAALLVLAFAAGQGRRLHSLTVGAVGAGFGVVVALVDPRTLSQFAVTGLVGTGLGFAVVRLAARLPLSRVAAVATAAAGAAVCALVCVGAAFLDIPDRGVPLACGLLVSAGVAALGDLLGLADDVRRRRVCAAAGGVVATALLTGAQVIVFGDSALLTAGVAATLLFAVAVPTTSRWQVTVIVFVAAGAALAEGSAQMSLQAQAFQAVALGPAAAGAGIVAVVLAGASLVWYPSRLAIAAPAAAGAATAMVVAVAEAAGVHSALTAADSTSAVAAMAFALAMAVTAMGSRRAATVAAAVAVPAGLAVGISVDAALALRVVRTVEAFVVAPGAVALIAGIVAMARLRSLTSWALAPALAVSLSPTLLLALNGDLTRQVTMLVVGASLVAVGAQLRLACPLTAGGLAVAAVVLRVLGPQVAELPRWLTLGVLGAALLVLGSTWERRLQDARRVADRVRPAVAALR